MRGSHGRAHVGSICLRLVSRVCLSAASFFGPAVFGLQMIMLDLVIADAEHTWFWLFVIVEFLLLMHMLLHGCSASQVVRSGSLQWIIYSWLISAKSAVLYFRILPRASQAEANNVVTLMCLTPLFYCVVTFRTLQQVFRGSESDQAPRKTSQSPSQKGRWGEHGTLDVVLLQDMVWHVVIDMVDITSIMLLLAAPDAESGNSDAGLESLLSIYYPGELQSLCTAGGLFVVLALFFHQQSFPSIYFAGSRDSDLSGVTPGKLSTGSFGNQASFTSYESQRKAEMDSDDIIRTSSSQMRLSAAASHAVMGQRVSMDSVQTESPSSSKYQQRQKQEYGVDVVKARKRSAIVSILLVDLPFFVIRTLIYTLSLWSLQLEASGTVPPPSHLVTVPVALPSPVPSDGMGVLQQQTTLLTRPPTPASGTPPSSSSNTKPRLDKWWIKNLMCLLLQAMQLRFVQQADLEQSQTLQWLSVHRSERRAARNTAKRRQSALDQEAAAQLKSTWEEMDAYYERSKLDAALQAVGASAATDSEEVSDAPFEATLTVAASLTMPPSAPPLIYVSDDSSKDSKGTPELHDHVNSHNLSQSSFSVSSFIGFSVARNVLEKTGWCCSRRRCKTFRLPVSFLILQAIMGFLLGWLLAKTDFSASLTELMVGLAAESSLENQDA